MKPNFRNAMLRLAAAALVAGPIAAAADMSTASKAVWDGHLQKVMGHDLDAVMTDFTDGSAIVTTDKVYVGRDAIRGFLGEFIKGLTPEAAKSMVVDLETPHDNVVFFKFTIGAAKRTFVDTAVIEDGKILTITTASYPAE